MSKQALADQAHSALLALILDGSFPPGEALRVAHIAERLGTSPTPVREALARLEGQRLVERSPMRGFTVARPLAAEQIDMLMQARLLIEPAIAAGAVSTRGLVERLRENLIASFQCDVGATFPGYRRYLELSAAFHALIAAACPNQFLTQALTALPVHVHRFRAFGSGRVDDVEVSLAEHARIAGALASGEPEEARKAMAEHVEAVLQRTLVAMQKPPVQLEND